MPYAIEFSPAAAEHLAGLTARQQRIVLDAVYQQLTHRPTERTRHRKPLRPNALAEWELRIGDIRVYYLVLGSRAVVSVVAVGHKRGDRVIIAGEEIHL